MSVNSLFFVCLLLLMTSLSSAVLSPSPTPTPQAVIRIAVIMHGPDDYNETLPDNAVSGLPEMWPIDYNPYNLALYQTWRLFTELLNAGGGFRFLTPNPLTNATSAQLQLDYFNIGRLYTPEGLFNVAVISRLATLLPKLVDPTGPYGAYTLLIAPPFTWRELSISVMSMCTTTQKCLAFVPMEPAPSVYMCMDMSQNKVENPLLPQPDCANKYPGARRFDYGYSALSDPSNVYGTTLSVLGTQGARTVAFVALSNSELDYDQIQSAKDLLFQQQMVSVYENYWSSEITSTGYLNASMALLLAQKLQSLNVDVVMVTVSLGFPPGISNGVLLLQALEQINWMPKAFCVAGSGDVDVRRWFVNANLTYMSDYIMGIRGWSKDMRGPDYHVVDAPWSHAVFISNGTMDSPANWRRMMVQRFGDYSPAIGEIFYAAGGLGAIDLIAYQFAIETCGGADSVSCMNSALNRLSAPSIYGRLQLDNANRMMMVQQPVFQYQPYNLPPSNLNLATVYPSYIGESFIYPIPQFWERVYSNALYQQTSEVSVAIVNSVLILYCFVLLAGVNRWRTHAIIKASMPDFLVLIIVGGILMLASTYFAALKVTDNFCRASSWLLTIGFTLMFSALFSKTFCVYYIFASTSKQGGLTIIKSPRAFLYGAVFICIFVDIVINFLWTFLGPIKSEMVVVDVDRPVYNYTQCAYTTASFRCIIASIVMKGIMILFGLGLTWKAKDVPDRFNETTYLCFAIYNVFVFGMFLVPVVGFGVGGRLTTYYIRSFGVMLFVWSTLSIMLFYKFYLILTGHTVSNHTSFNNSSQNKRFGLSPDRDSSGPTKHKRTNSTHTENTEKSHENDGGQESVAPRRAPHNSSIVSMSPHHSKGKPSSVTTPVNAHQSALLRTSSINSPQNRPLLGAGAGALTDGSSTTPQLTARTAATTAMTAPLVTSSSSPPLSPANERHDVVVNPPSNSNPRFGNRLSVELVTASNKAPPVSVVVDPVGVTVNNSGSLESSPSGMAAASPEGSPSANAAAPHTFAPGTTIVTVTTSSHPRQIRLHNMI